MTKEERKEYKRIRKEKMRFSKAAKWLYAVFVLLLLGASGYAVKYMWDECAAYQKASAATRVDQAMEYVESITDLDLKTNMIPVRSEEGRITYRIYAENKPIADVELTKTRSCGIVLSIYDEPVIKSLVSYDLLIPTDAEVELREGDELLDSETLVSDIEETAFNRFTVPGKRELGNMGIPVPAYKWVKAEGIYDASQIRVLRNDKELKITEKNEGELFAFESADDDFNQALRKRAAYCAEKYANFISNDYPYYSLSQLICWNSPLPSRLLNVTLTWYGDHTGVEAKNMKVSDAFKLTDDDYMLNVIFDYISYRASGSVEEKTMLTVYLHNEYGDWKISELTNNIQADWIKAYELDR